MVEDMRLRELEPRSQEAYLHCSPDTDTVEDLRNFQRYLVEEISRRHRGQF
jgi:integrase/recombinase XerD